LFAIVVLLHGQNHTSRQWGWIFTQYIAGMDRAESDALLAHLYAQAAIPEYQCRFRWQKNSIAFWDNRACQHYAVSDYWPAVRRMERVTIIGDRPR
jgi:taurine dioxygenase